MCSYFLLLNRSAGNQSRKHGRKFCAKIRRKTLATFCQAVGGPCQHENKALSSTPWSRVLCRDLEQSGYWYSKRKNACWCWTIQRCRPWFSMRKFGWESPCLCCRYLEQHATSDVPQWCPHDNAPHWCVLQIFEMDNRTTPCQIHNKNWKKKTSQPKLFLKAVLAPNRHTKRRMAANITPWLIRWKCHDRMRKRNGCGY